MRQDAIMEQVFEQVSVLLRKGRITRQRNLKIRTYKVMPLSSTSGIIEFVPNTIPLGEYLLPAHAKYYPKGWKHLQCRKVIQEAQGKSRDIRVSEYQRAAQNFPPVMHFFFMHEFNGPDEWYSSRLAYTRSTAAISILGHVLGLGDRHIHNILLDTKTGEVIHIDLGVAFEQVSNNGKIDMRLTLTAVGSRPACARGCALPTYSGYCRWDGNHKDRRCLPTLLRIYTRGASKRGV